MSTLTATQSGLRARPGWIDRINSTAHEKALWIYLAIVVAHWAEHLTQAFQIWVLEMPRPEAKGVLGYFIPALVTTEALHFTYAVLMLAGLVLLRPGFAGAARTWWTISLAIQGWHLVEHSLLQLQAIVGVNFFSSPVPSSILQNWIPRVELHLFYNAIVFIPMVVAMWLHTRPNQPNVGELRCTCAHA